VFGSTNSGSTWSSLDTGLSNRDVWALAAVGTDLFAGTYGGGVFRSTDSGTTWIAASDGLADTTVLALAFDGTRLFAGTLGGVYYSTDRGAGWISSNSGLGSVFIRCLGVNGTKLFAGTYGGGVFRSTDSGAHWTSASAGLTNTDVLDFAFLGPNVYAGTYGGMFFSANDGDQWYSISITDSLAKAGLFSKPSAPKAIYSFAVSDPNLFVGTFGGGVFLSTDAGDSWTPVNAGLGNRNVSILSVQGASLYVGTLSGEVWRCALSDITSVETTSSRVTSAFTLEQNFPNPFNSMTDIRYQISHLGNVRLSVYDLLGRVVAVLVNQRQAPGSYHMRFDGTGLSSGVYFYQLSVVPSADQNLSASVGTGPVPTNGRDAHAAELVQTRKLLLLR
jgi:photosystem II stability/assembly factor-like uncharacterized protein